MQRVKLWNVDITITVLSYARTLIRIPFEPIFTLQSSDLRRHVVWNDITHNSKEYTALISTLTMAAVYTYEAFRSICHSKH
jgi:hypothetical protein